MAISFRSKAYYFTIKQVFAILVSLFLSDSFNSIYYFQTKDNKTKTLIYLYIGWWKLAASQFLLCGCTKCNTWSIFVWVRAIHQLKQNILEYLYIFTYFVPGHIKYFLESTKQNSVNNLKSDCQSIDLVQFTLMKPRI